MKLSDLIEQGMVGKTQCFSDFFEPQYNNDAAPFSHCCALGAAFYTQIDTPEKLQAFMDTLAQFRKDELMSHEYITSTQVEEALEKVIGYKITKQLVNYPPNTFDRLEANSIYTVIWHLNDKLRWSFEQIIVWLREEGL